VKGLISAIRNDGLSFRCLVVDSDASSRKTLIELLATHPSIQMVRGCANGLEAISAIPEYKPDVLVCEIEGPQINGFAMVETISPKDRPVTIFISRYDRFAARAFDVAAADYLVKPIGKERLWKALERAKNQFESVKAQDTTVAPERRSRQLVIRSGRSVIFVKSDEVDWAEAEGKYVRLHMGKEFLILKIGISALEAELDPDQFVRIHRSTLINVDRVRLVQPWNHRRTYQVTLQDGTQLVLSRKSKLLEMGGRSASGTSELHSRSESNSRENLWTSRA
jgi:two-component system, LytTR family, response regulator